jgi:hypothetical protein
VHRVGFLARPLLSRSIAGESAKDEKVCGCQAYTEPKGSKNYSEPAAVSAKEETRRYCSKCVSSEVKIARSRSMRVFISLHSAQYSRHLFFKYNTALGPPYFVLIDTNFLNASIQNKLDPVKAMMDCLLAKCK